MLQLTEPLKLVSTLFCRCSATDGLENFDHQFDSKLQNFQTLIVAAHFCITMWQTTVKKKIIIKEKEFLVRPCHHNIKGNQGHEAFLADHLT